MPEEKAAPGFVNTGVASLLIMRKNDKRSGAVLVNNSVNIIYVSLGQDPAVVNTGIPLYANGGAYEINQANPFHGAIYAIADGADSVLAITEIE